MELVEESNLLVLNKLERLLTVCKVKNIDDIDLSKEFYFIGKTDEEISLVCETNDVPENTIEREDGWRGFRIQGILDLIQGLQFILNMYILQLPIKNFNITAKSIPRTKCRRIV